MLFLHNLLQFNNNITRKYQIDIIVIVPQIDLLTVEKNILVQHYLPSVYSLFHSHFPNIQLSFFLVGLDNLVLQDGAIIGIDGGFQLIKSKPYQEAYGHIEFDKLWDSKKISELKSVTSRSFLYLMADELDSDKKFELHKIMTMTRRNGVLVHGSIPYPQYVIPPVLYKMSIPAFYGTQPARAIEFFHKYKEVELCTLYNHHDEKVVNCNLSSDKEASVEFMVSHFMLLSNEVPNKTVGIRKIQHGEKVRFFSFGGRILPVIQRYSDGAYFIIDKVSLSFMIKFLKPLEEKYPAFSRVIDVIISEGKNGKQSYLVQTIQNEFLPDLMKIDKFIKQNNKKIDLFIQSLAKKDQEFVCDYLMDGLLYQAIYKTLTYK